MTELTSLLTDGAGVQPAETALSGADAEIWERSRGRSLTWPVTRLARWFFSLLLAAGLYFPSATAGDEWQRLTLVPLAARSEEHTSELQSRPQLVCRPL